MTNEMHSNNPSRFLRGEMTNRWQYLTSGEIDECCSDQSKVIDILQSRYGYARGRAEKEANLFFTDLQDRLRLAA